VQTLSVSFSIIDCQDSPGYHPSEMRNPEGLIAVCICTYKRPALLTRLLEKIALQRTDDLFSISVTVVDNDIRGSGQEAVRVVSSRSMIPIAYHMEPERNISLARNRSIESSEGGLVALIDDDEFPDREWLINHYRALAGSTASGVLGPVRSSFESPPPRWLVKSGLLERPEFPTGAVLPDSRYTRTGNALLRRSIFADKQNRFDPKFGRTGGGDAAFFKRLMDKNHHFIWCNEAVVYEIVLPERQAKSYYLKRAFTRGMTEAQETPFLSLCTLRSIAAIPLYGLLLPFAWLVGQHIFMRYLVKECDHLSLVLAHAGIKPVKERPY
jgi:succinoglycan biosynthesis protein ExoM